MLNQRTNRKLSQNIYPSYCLIVIDIVIDNLLKNTVE